MQFVKAQPNLNKTLKLQSLYTLYIKIEKLS